MPDTNEDEERSASLDSGHVPPPRRTGPPEVEALHRLNELIGNREHLGPKSLGKARGIVLDTLNAWHRRQAADDDALARIAGVERSDGYLLSDAVLDRVPRFTRTPPHPADVRVFDDVGEALAALTVDPGPPGHPTSIAHGDLFAPSPAHPVALRTFGPGLVEYDGRTLRIQYDRSGRDAIVARLEQERDDARRQVVEQGEAAEEQADALRSEVARLSGLLDEAYAALASMHGKRDRARDHAVRNDGERDSCQEQLDGLLDRLRTFVANLAAEDWRRRSTDWPWVLARPRKIAASIEELVLGERVDPADDLRSSDPDGDGPPNLVEEVVVPELLGSSLQPLAEVSPHPIEDDPRRPHLDHYPEDALLLTYRELRQLLALHVEAVGDSVLSADDQAREMRDGATPLRLAEVVGR